MDVSPDFRVPSSPLLKKNDLSGKQLETAKSVESHLRGMGNASQDLVAAIALYEFCQNNALVGLFKDWAFMGARAGALAIRDFGQALSRVRALVGQVDAWDGKVNLIGLRKADKLFRHYFPTADKLRHSVAHPELYADPNKSTRSNGPFEGSGVKFEHGGFQIQNGIFNDNYTATFDGAVLQYHIASPTAGQLVMITRQVFDAFQELDWPRNAGREPPPAN